MGKAIAIVPYDARWPAEFDRIGTALRSALGEMALLIDHIGSTAVPGLAAKDIIDVQVTVAALDAAERWAAATGHVPGCRITCRDAGSSNPSCRVTFLPHECLP